MSAKVLLAAAIEVGLLVFFVAGWRSSAPVAASGDSSVLSGASAVERAAFEEGREDFEEVEAMDDGLGPVFNGRSCAECHAQPSVGGSSPELTNARETRIGARRNGVFDPLVALGGSVLQRRSAQEDIPSLPLSGEVVPPQATIVSRRMTTPLFGAGLIQAISDDEILRCADPNDRDRDGISGRPNLTVNPETGRMEVGRFGWKADVSTLHLFAGIAYLNEMGITSPLFPDENLPQGKAIPRGADLVSGLEDDGSSLDRFAAFMQFLAPLSRRPSTPQIESGERVFAQVGCTSCHVPTMTTGNNRSAALRFQRVNLYSDLLLHDMGSGLADGIEQQSALGNEFRTAPLWGLSRRLFFLHDGRARHIADAISAHGGEAAAANRRFQELPQGQRDALLAFLGSL